MSYPNGASPTRSKTSILNANTLIKADRLRKFKQGYAIVQYGKAQGLIDNTGKFVIPYNKYQLNSFDLGSLDPATGFINGGCVMRDLKTGLMGMTDQFGKLIIGASYTVVNPFDIEGWAIVTGENSQDYFISKSGVKVPVPEIFYERQRSVLSKSAGLEDLFSTGAVRAKALSGRKYIGKFSNGVSPGRLPDGSYSYFDRKGKQIITRKFGSAHPFSEGLACVGNKNEFGEMMYGFIDKTGKLVIPYTFTKIPGDFYNGLAYIEPVNTSEFSFAFVNKLGQIVFKQPDSQPSNSKSLPHFENGYFRMFVGYNKKLKVIDSTGSEVKALNTLKAIVANESREQDTYQGYYIPRNHIQSFKYARGNASKAGFINLKTGKIVYTDFAYVGDFDLTSGLALAGDDRANEKYIDLNGNVVIELAKGNEF